MTKQPTDINTRAVHAGASRPRFAKAIVTPIFQSSTYEYHGEDYHDVGYMRLSNTPNHAALAAKIAALEATPSALVCASGMAAISATLLTQLGAGDHLLVQDCLYGGTTGLVTHELARFGISHDTIDPQDSSSWQDHVRPETKAIYVETLTNPLVQVADLEAVPVFARDKGLVSIVDNTFASPANFRPAEHGFDYVIESCTKYMNGHNDIVAGSVAGGEAGIRNIKLTLDHLGGTLDPNSCYLLERGLKTLPLRVSHQSRSALGLARFLAEHQRIERVHYPGLTCHAQHARASRLFQDFGGMMAFEVSGGVEAAERFLSRLSIPTVAASLGGAESLIVRPAAAIHSGLSAEERQKTGVSDALIRFSVGLESEEDLRRDLDQALHD